MGGRVYSGMIVVESSPSESDPVSLWCCVGDVFSDSGLWLLLKMRP